MTHLSTTPAGLPRELVAVLQLLALEAAAPLEVVRGAAEQVFASGLAGPRLTIAWHGDEPLAAGLPSFESALAEVERARRLLAPRTVVVHAVQTKGLVLSPAWCELLARWGVFVGVELDGPAALHDARRAEPTHARVVAGVELLRRAGVEPHAVAAVSRASLEQPDALYDFFRRAGVRDVRLTLDELGAPDAEVARFFGRLLTRALGDLPERRVSVRELDTFAASLLDGRPRVPPPRRLESAPMRVLGVSRSGDWVTYSPALLGAPHPTLGSFVLGNVLTTPLLDGLTSPKLGALDEEVRAGVEACRASCSFFDFCGGGAAASKLQELGRLSGTETRACRLGTKALVRGVLDSLEAFARSVQSN